MNNHSLPRVRASADSHRRITLVLAVLATSLSNLEVGLVNVALPTLAATFDASTATIQWVAVAYQIAIVATLIVFGRLTDLVGSRAIYLVGMATVSVGSILAALSVHVLWLILARGVLGIGAAALLATSQALIADAYRDAGRGRAFGMLHMAVATGLMAGPSVGGAIISVLNWRFIFALPVAITIPALWIAWRALPGKPRPIRATLDLPGAALITLTLMTVVFGLTRVASTGLSASSMWLLTAAIVFGATFVAVERRQHTPLFEFSLLTDWRLTAGLLAALFTFVALASNMFLIPFALQDLMRYSPAQAGLTMMTVPLVILPVAPLAGALADRIGSRIPTTFGLAAIAISIAGMASFKATTSVGIAVAVLAVYGLGAGLFQAPNNRSVLGAAPADRSGIVSGMLALSRNLGQIVGIVVASMIWTWRESVYQSRSTMNSTEILAAGLRDAFLVLAAIALVALMISAVRDAG